LFVHPLRTLAAWRQAGFEARTPDDAVKGLGLSAPIVASELINIRAPEIAENSAQVPIEVSSEIPATTSIAVMVENNQNPLTAVFDIYPGTLPFVSLRVKMADTSQVRAFVTAGGVAYTAAVEVKVTIGGCGG
jgi:sulfur-oxidizing protein SoxY